ncbi:spore protease YyaC [Parageobacillus sp. G301]|jgi:putative sporulation protein YyaC|uniref:spore protease YyaC n=1 Tax=Parageobacillus sp. G301 TaxID=2998290 RepID=UPI00249924C2|nr:spore protease YyaC [Parageobacillus sp. G301]GLH63454.1 spore protease YyaC [Parageobacillus sp. G301]
MQPIFYDNPLAPLLIRNYLFSSIPEYVDHLVVLCIGSNRINGDSLGPFVGTLLSGLYPKHMTIIGNLKRPVDATNIKEIVKQFPASPSTYTLAIDSVVGISDYIHTIVVRNGALTPGSALDKNLPSVGDISIMGVMMEDCENIATLSYTNLHIVYQMAKAIALGISLTVRQRFGYESTSSILINN